MKILAMIDVIFLPLVFLAGVYGMNFKGDQMPELSSSHGYLIFWMVCLGFALLSLFWFYKKKWVVSSNTYVSLLPLVFQTD